MRPYLSSIVASGLMLMGFALHAQTDIGPCGTYDLGQERQEFLRQFQQTDMFRDFEDGRTTYYIPVTMHIVGKTNGEGFFPTSDALRVMCETNQQYQPIGFHFYIHGDIRYIKNDSYYEHTFQQGTNMMQQNNVPGTLNMYIVNDPAGTCGYFSGFRDAVALSKSCIGIGSTTTAHEFGHYFSLPHTFHGWEGATPPAWQRERVDGSNCNTTGDGFCDTPADYLSDRWNCPYSGPVLKDPIGDTLNPDATLIMSYSSDICQTRFSPQQRSAMRTFLVTQRSVLLGQQAPLTSTPPNPPVQQWPNENQTLTPNHATFIWNKTFGANLYRLQVSRMAIFGVNDVDVVIADTIFTATKLLNDRTYYWRVSALTNGNTCNETTSPGITFKTGQPTGISAPELTDFSLYPNPVGAGEALVADLSVYQNLKGMAMLTDLYGRTVWQESLTGNNSILQIPTAQLSKGVYLFHIRGDQGLGTRRVVIQ
jgi:hypothetical protein